MKSIPRTAEHVTPLDVGEVDDVPFDFADDIRFDETIGTPPGVTAAVEQGEDDPLAQAMVVGTPRVGVLSDDGKTFTESAAGPVVLVRMAGAGRNVGATYCVRCLVVLSSGRRLVLAAHVPVVRL